MVGAVPAKVTSISPEPFARAVRELAAMRWRPGFSTDEIGSPQRIAPHSVAIAGELAGDDEPLASGRLILLYDPAGNETTRDPVPWLALSPT